MRCTVDEQSDEIAPSHAHSGVGRSDRRRIRVVDPEQSDARLLGQIVTPHRLG